MRPMTEAQFLRECHGLHGFVDDDLLEEAFTAFLRSHGFEDMARLVPGMIEDARSRGYKDGSDNATSMFEDRLDDLKDGYRRIREALNDGRTDKAKELIASVIGPEKPK